MDVYSFHCVDPKGAIAQSQRLTCKDDLDALSEGVRRSKAHAVQIFQGNRLVARVKLGDAPLDVTDLYSL